MPKFTGPTLAEEADRRPSSSELTHSQASFSQHPHTHGSTIIGSGQETQNTNGHAVGGGGKRQTPVKRACDQCHFRRVKCDGLQPCNNCPRLSVQCTYEKPRLRGTSGKRINALRADQQQATQQPGSQTQSNQRPSPQDPSPPSYTPSAAAVPPSTPSSSTYPASSQQLSPLPLAAWSSYPSSLPLTSPPLSLSAPNDVQVQLSSHLQAQDTSFASFLESTFSALPPEVSASYRLPNVDTYIPDTFFDSKPLLSSSHPAGGAGGAGNGVGAGAGAGEMMFGFGGLGGFLHPSPPSWAGSEGSPQMMLHATPAPTQHPTGSGQNGQPFATQRQQQQPQPQLHSAPNPAPTPAPAPALPPPPPPPASPLSDSVLIPHIALFFERLHPIMPIFTRSWLFTRLDRSEHTQDPQFASMLLSMSALALTQPVQASEHSSALGPENRLQARHLLEEACRMRSSALFGQQASIDCVLTSFYIFACLFGMKEDNAAWFRLTEAVTLGQLLKLHVPGSYEGLEKGERERRLRTYWILCITERAYALQRGHPITFRGRPSQDMTAISSALQVGELDDFPVRHLKLFDSVDENFIDCWNGRCAGRACRNLTAERAIALHKQLSEPLDATAAGSGGVGRKTPSGASENVEALSTLTSSWKRGEIQSADVLITQQWLLNRLWRLCMSHGLISPSPSSSSSSSGSSSSSVEPALRVDLPVTIAHRALAICNSLSMPAIEAHGIGYLEKLYDIATTLAVLGQYAPEVVSGQHTRSDAGNHAGSQDGHGAGLSVSMLLAEYVALFRRFRAGDHPFMGKLVEAVGHLLPP